VNKFFGVKKNRFRAGRHKNKGKRCFYFGLRIRILFPIKIQLLDIENLKKSTSPIAQVPGTSLFRKLNINSLGYRYRYRGYLNNTGPDLKIRTGQNTCK
jgi:hypothetical protein